MPRLLLPPPHCPACGQSNSELLTSFPGPIGERVVQLIQRDYPTWIEGDGVCDRCENRYLQEALRQLARENVWGELNEYREIVYDDNLAHIIPTPERVHANPLYTGRGVTIAFIDSGFYPHPDLMRPSHRILRYVDVTDAEAMSDDDFSRPRVTSWHGMMTSVSATGSGHLSGGLYRGIASDAQVVLVRVSDPVTGRIDDEAIYRGIAWVIANQTRYNIRVVNISLGGDLAPVPGNYLDRKANEAVRRGMVVVAASGNFGTRRLYPPASASRVITVGGLDDRNTVDRSQHRMYWSSWQGTPTHPKPELIAPSIWVAAPILPDTRVHQEAQALDRLVHLSKSELRLAVRRAPRWLGLRPLLGAPLPMLRDALRKKFRAANLISAHYKHVDGTSFAAPIVAAVVAQMLEANPSLTPDEVKHILIETANPLPGVERERQGYGVVNPSRAVAAALRRGAGPMASHPVSPWVHDGQVTFTYQNPDAQGVRLTASFTLWNPEGPRFRQDAPGIWTLTIPAPPPGRYAYKFIVDDALWMPDPENGFQAPDGFGSWNAVLTVPRRHVRRDT